MDPGQQRRPEHRGRRRRGLRFAANYHVSPATVLERAEGYGLWVRGIRTAEGAIEYPTLKEARAHDWTEEDRALVQDRVDTQFVGSPGKVADQLRQLREATGADELLIATMEHEHTDRVRSYRLLAEEWARR